MIIIWEIISRQQPSEDKTFQGRFHHTWKEFVYKGATFHASQMIWHQMLENRIVCQYLQKGFQKRSKLCPAVLQWKKGLNKSHIRTWF